MNNFTVRTISSVVFVAVMLAGLLLSPIAYGCLFLVIMTVAMQEFYGMALGRQYAVQQKLALLTAAAFFTIVLCHCNYGLDGRWAAAGLIPLTAIPVSVLMKKERPDFGSFSHIFVALVYIALPICLSPFLVFTNGTFSGITLLSLFILIWVSDVGAYCLGTAFGQKPDSRKLAPSISPKKSWWGFWGGVILCVVAAFVLHLIGWLPYGLVHSLVLGAIISMAGVCGDLFESLWKRWFGVKDSGNCIPGHGGMLDRFDSSLLAIPVAVVYLTLFGLL